MSDDNLTPRDIGKILDGIEVMPAAAKRWEATLLALMRQDPHPMRDERIATIKAIFQNEAAVRAAQGDEQATAELQRQGRALQRHWKKLLSAPPLSAAAQELMTTPDMARFSALLPDVALDRRHHQKIDHKVSPFPLIWAIEARKSPLERVQKMLNAGASLLLTDSVGWTVLHEMMARPRKAPSRLAILRLLVLKGADLEACTIYGRTPLLVALERGTATDAAHLIAVGAKVGAEDLKMACNDRSKLALLLDHLAKRDDLPALVAEVAPWLRGHIATVEARRAARHRSGSMTRHLEAQLTELKTAQDRLAQIEGFKPIPATRGLHYSDEPAAFLAVQHAPTLTEFRNALMQVDIATYPQDGITHPIYWALEAESQRAERLWALLAAGASVNGSTRCDPPLHCLVRDHRRKDIDQERLVQILVQAGARIEARDSWGRTALQAAVSVNALPEAKALLIAGADPNATGPFYPKYMPERQGPPLFAAADRPKMFRLLLDHGADPDQRAGTQSLESYVQQELNRADAELNSAANGVTMRARWTRYRNGLSKVQAMLRAQAST